MGAELAPAGERAAAGGRLKDDLMSNTPKQQSGSMEYRPAIDGLRAIAILSVFFFHLNHAWLPGGFLGVDVFFVISGYLITSIIVKDCENGVFSLVKFYQRRIARIIPAFFTVGIATLAGAYLFYSNQDFASAGSNLTAASLSLANVKYMLQGNYFTISPDARPLLHYWSLSVEEQFYMVFPFLFLLLDRNARSQRNRVLGVLFAASLLLCVWMTKAKPIWAFYLAPTRAWELLAGSMLAVALSLRTSPTCMRWPAWGSLFGLILILLSFLIVREGPSFPGAWPLLAVAGAVSVLMPSSGSIGVGERLLAVPLLVYLGKISYSLYLWHWPIFSFVDYSLYLAAPPIRLALKVGLSLVVAGASFRYIENPSRLFLNRRERRPAAYLSLLFALAFCVPVGLTVRNHNLANAQVSDVEKGGVVFNPHGRAGSVVLMGDSHGAMYGVVMRGICNTLDQKLTVISVPGWNPLPVSRSEQDGLWAASLAVVKRERPRYLVLACRWNVRLDENKERLAIALEALRPHVGRIVILTQPPILPENADRASMRRGARPPFYEEAGMRRSREEANDYVRSFNGTNCMVIDIASRFIKGNGEVTLWDAKGRLFYQDRDHLSGVGTAWVEADLRRGLSP